MMKNTGRRNVTAIILFIAAGIAVGAAALSGGASVTATAPFPTAGSFAEIKEFVFDLCSSTVAECLLLLISGFTAYPAVVACPVFFVRGCAVSYAVRCATSSPQAVSAIVSYGVITVLMIFLAYAAADFSSVKNKRSPRELLPLANTYLLITGAAITVKVVPLIITTEFINKI